MEVHTFDSVWDAIEDDPGIAENLRVRSRLMIALREHLKSKKLTQVEAAKLFGVTQRQISALSRGEIDLFSLDTLVNMVAAAGLDIELKISDAA